MFYGENHSGKRFGRWTVIERSLSSRKWMCKCDCGNVKDVAIGNLKNGGSKSCGCLRKDLYTKHGLHQHRLYPVYQNMIARCYDPACDSFSDYGTRGITVCDEWQADIQSFYNWAIQNGYQQGLQLDRRENNGNYNPGNCRFVTCTVNNRNKRNNRLIKFNGETKCLSEWAESAGMSKESLHYRLKAGWTIEKAITKEVHHA